MEPNPQISRAGGAPSDDWLDLIKLAITLAFREMRGGIRGLGVLIACIALGVGAIAAVGTLNSALNAGLADRGQVLLGGDLSFSLVQRRVTSEERAYLEALGAVSEVVTMRAMARTDKSKIPVLVEVKGTDGAYPLYGSLETNKGSLSDVSGILMDKGLALRFGVGLGDHFYLGEASLTIGGLLKSEPDSLSGRAAFGPRILLPRKELVKTGLLGPGSLVHWHYRVKLAGGHRFSRDKLKEIGAGVKKRFPKSGFRIRDRLNPAPGLNRAVTMFSEFLTLIGMTALLAGGLGVANAVASLMQRKRKTIAIFKSLGAQGHHPFLTYLFVVLMLTLIGILIGLVFGSLAPYGIKLFYADALPLPFDPGLFPLVWLKAALFGLLVGLLFLLWPLGKSLEIHPTDLFRQDYSFVQRAWPSRLVIFATLIVLVTLVSLAIFFAEARMIVVYFSAGAVVLFALFHGFAKLASKALLIVPVPRNLPMKLARASLTGPEALLYPVMISLGLGLTLIVALSLVRGSLLQELSLGLPQKAPGFYFLDISKSDYPAFESIAARYTAKDKIVSAPMLRGRITALKGEVPDIKKAAPGIRWVLRGDRGITYADKVPKASTLVEGKWWPQDYEGIPLVSFEEGAAKGLGLKIGDEVSVNILGREITAKIYNLRRVKWESLAMNFVMVFSPNTVKGAPHKFLATLSLPSQSDQQRVEQEAKLLNAVSDRFPTITAVRVRDALDAINAIVGNIALAVTAAGGLTLIAGALVLAGALAAAERQRSYEAAIFKTLGAKRRQILAAHLSEYLAISLVTAFAAICLGGVSAYLLVTKVMELPFHLSFGTMLSVLIATLSIVLLTGLLGTWRVLSAKATAYLAPA